MGFTIVGANLIFCILTSAFIHPSSLLPYVYPSLYLMSSW